MVDQNPSTGTLLALSSHTWWVRTRSVAVVSPRWLRQRAVDRIAEWDGDTGSHLMSPVTMDQVVKGRTGWSRVGPPEFSPCLAGAAGWSRVEVSAMDRAVAWRSGLDIKQALTAYIYAK